MTPQKKAEELTEKMFLILSKRGEHHYTFNYSKECALLAADEIMQTISDIILPNPFRQYWKEVKQEIEKL